MAFVCLLEALKINCIHHKQYIDFREIESAVVKCFYLKKCFVGFF